MMYSLALDALLVVIVLLLIPVGLYRGGLREVCTAAGLLLAYLLANAWSARWGTWLANVTGIDEGVSRFVVAVIILVVVTGAVGYGAAAAFTYRPGPGGRLYGGLISLFAGVIFLGALIEFVQRHLHDGELPGIVRDGYVSRALATGFDWVLLVVGAGVLAATVFGTFVRERDSVDFMLEVPQHSTLARRSVPVPARAPEPDSVEPRESVSVSGELSEPTAAVRIREVRHWEDQSPPSPADLQTGWTQTWPALDREPIAKGRSIPNRNTARALHSHPMRSAQPDADVLRTWLEEDQRFPADQVDRKPQSDE